MERLVREGKLDAVLDLTTTEICDLVTGGVMAAGPDRLDAATQAGIPCIVSLVSTVSHILRRVAHPRYADHGPKGRDRYEQLRP